MPVSPFTPLSLVASVNLEYLREAFRDLEKNHGFYVDTGAWCCRTCAGADAWEEGVGKPFVFWHEQGEEGLHEAPGLEMALYFGVAKVDASDHEIIDAARKIIAVLGEHDFKSDWKDGDLETAIMVHLDTHEPDVDDEAPDYQNVCLYVPENEDTKEFCENESEEDFGEPKDTYNFHQEIMDGESLKDAVLRIDQKVRRHITHYQRFIDMGECGYPLEPLFEIDHAVGHAGCGESLLDVLDEESKEKEVQLEKLLISDNPMKYMEFIRKQEYQFDLSSKGLEIPLYSEEAKLSFYRKFEEWNKKSD